MFHSFFLYLFLYTVGVFLLGNAIIVDANADDGGGHKGHGDETAEETCAEGAGGDDGSDLEYEETDGVADGQL